MDETVEYRDVVGFPGYKVGNDGSVWSNRNNRVAGWYRLMANVIPNKYRGKIRCQGYLNVTLQAADGGGSKNRRVHRLVLEAFVGPCPVGMEACHKDGNPANNRPDNLRWGTSKENAADQERHGTKVIGSARHNSKLTEDQVMEIHKAWSQGEGAASLSARYGLARPNIGAILLGKKWKHVHAAYLAQGGRPCELDAFGRLKKFGPLWRKLTAEDVEEIRRLHAGGGHTFNSLANRFGVSPSTVSNLVRRIRAYRQP